MHLLYLENEWKLLFFDLFSKSKALPWIDISRLENTTYSWLIHLSIRNLKVHDEEDYNKSDKLLGFVSQIK